MQDYKNPIKVLMKDGRVGYLISTLDFNDGGDIKHRIAIDGTVLRFRTIRGIQPFDIIQNDEA